jgi:hypothetical protein
MNKDSASNCKAHFQILGRSQLGSSGIPVLNEYLLHKKYSNPDPVSRAFATEVNQQQWLHLDPIVLREN